MPGCLRPRLAYPKILQPAQLLPRSRGSWPRKGDLADGDHAITIEQGYEMGRPSLIRLDLALKAGSLVSAAVGGDAVLVTEGVIEA